METFSPPSEKQRATPSSTRPSSISNTNSYNNQTMSTATVQLVETSTLRFILPHLVITAFLWSLFLSSTRPTLEVIHLISTCNPPYLQPPSPGAGVKGTDLFQPGGGGEGEMTERR